jgi:hypothetical protein
MTTTELTRTVGFANVMRSEWTKLTSVRSTYWTAFAAVVATLGIGIVLAAHWASNINADPAERIGFDPTSASLSGIYVAQVAIGTLGVLAISSEYGTGMIRATFGAVPQRRALLAAKGVTFAIATFVLGELVSFTTFALGQLVLADAHAGASFGDPGVLRAVAGAGLYLAAVGLLGFGLGGLIRHTAGALSTFFGVLFALTVLVDLLPTNWHNDLVEYLPASSGSQIFTIVRTHDSLSPWAGLGVFCLYPLVALLGAFVLIGRRDA